MKMNKVNDDLVSEELYRKSIGMLNDNPLDFTADYKNCIIHMIDSVSRGYISPMEAYEALAANYFPENLRARPSSYQHLV